MMPYALPIAPHTQIMIHGPPLTARTCSWWHYNNLHACCNKKESFLKVAWVWSLLVTHFRAVKCTLSCAALIYLHALMSVKKKKKKKKRSQPWDGVPARYLCHPDQQPPRTDEVLNYVFIIKKVHSGSLCPTAKAKDRAEEMVRNKSEWQRSARPQSSTTSMIDAPC